MQAGEASPAYLPPDFDSLKPLNDDKKHHSKPFEQTPCGQKLLLPEHEFRNPLHSLGYQVFHKVFGYPDFLVKEMQRQAQSLRTRIVNKNEATRVCDNKRLIGPLTLNSKVMTLFKQLASKMIIERVGPQYEVGPFKLIRSLQGCQEQGAQTVCLPNKQSSSLKHQQIQLIALIALEDGTKLNVWPRSIGLINEAKEEMEKRKTIDCETLILNRGDLVVYRTDLVHSQAAYQKENIHLSCFLKVTGTPQPRIYTHMIYGRYACPVRAGVIRPKVGM